MSYRVHWMNTGEIEVSLGVSLLGLGYNPKMPGGQILTYGYQERIERADGTIGSGTMVPIPFYYIEDSFSAWGMYISFFHMLSGMLVRNRSLK